MKRKNMNKLNEKTKDEKRWLRPHLAHALFLTVGQESAPAVPEDFVGGRDRASGVKTSRLRWSSKSSENSKAVGNCTVS